MTNYTQQDYERDCKITADAPNESSDLHINGCGMYFESRNDLESYHKVSDLRQKTALYEQLQEANARIAELKSLATGLTNELEAEIEHRYAGLINVPHERQCTRNDYECDMAMVHEARTKLKQQSEGE